MKPEPSRSVATGIWLYDGRVPCKVIIQREEIWPDFFDQEDDSNTENKEIPCVSVWYGAPCNGGYTFNAGGGYYHTVEEAKVAIEKILPSHVEWRTNDG